MIGFYWNGFVFFVCSVLLVLLFMELFITYLRNLFFRKRRVVKGLSFDIFWYYFIFVI